MARVLIVDDDAVARALLRTRLEAQAHLVQEAADGQGAMAILSSSQTRFDAVLTDIFMPDMDGLELIKAIQAAQPSLPVVALSGGGAKVAINFLPMAHSLGAAAVLEKPVTRSALTNVLDQILTPSVAPTRSVS